DADAGTAALEEARAAQLGSSMETQLVESFAEPPRRVREGIGSDELAELLQLPKELRGLSPEDAERQEYAACEGLSREQLEARVVELSRVLAVGRLHGRALLEQALLTRLEAVDAASLKEPRAEEAVAARAPALSPIPVPPSFSSSFLSSPDMP
ncbi:unnamed protein product, partial [Prorocentrum cordatum]